MKEFEARIQMNRQELTGDFNPSTLDVRGNIFMPDGPGGTEQAPKNNTEINIPPKPDKIAEASVKEQVSSATTPKEARRLWEKYSGTSLDDIKDPDERQTIELAIEKGTVPQLAGGAPDADAEFVDVGKYKDPLLEDMAKGVTVKDVSSGAYLQEMKQELRELIRAGRADSQEARQFLRVLTDIERKLYEGEDTFRGFYLQEGDKKKLNEEDGPQKWLDLQFEILYDLTLEGQELSSPMISNMQTLAGEASRYMVLQQDDREAAKNFDTVFLNRLNLIQMRTAISYKDIENVKGAAFKLGVHGLLYGLGQEDGRVEMMFNRLQELTQSERLKEVSFHLSPDIASQLQDSIIAEQLDLADKGGIFEGKTEADIRRTVRIAYDSFVASHRMGVITARGGHLSDMKAYFSDPIGPFNIYSWEEMLTSKFGLFNHDQQKFLKEMKLEMADYHIKEKIKQGGKSVSMSAKEREEYGAKLLRDLFKVPDFFTSGWRVQGMLESLEERLGVEGAEDFALFLRLRDPRLVDEEEKPDEKKIGAIWMKIVKYKPDEIVGMFREADNKGLNNLYNEITSIDDLLKPSDEEAKRGTTVYDKFKDKYSAAIRLLREKGFDQNPPVQIDIASMTDWHKGVINRAMGGGNTSAGGDVQKIFAKMQEYINKDAMVDAIRTNHKFAGMLERTFVVDDALLHKMEETEIKKNDGTTEKVISLSKKFSNEPGGDALVRNWNDHENGAKAMTALIAFVQHGDDFEQNQKDAQAFAEALSQYNGIDEKARAYTFTRGTYLKLAEQNLFVDGLGLQKLPFRIKTSGIQRVFGPETKTISRDEARAILDHEKPLFMGSVLTKDLDDPEKIKKAAKFFYYIEKELDAKLGGAAKRRGITLIAWLMMFLGMEINEFRKSLMDEK